MNLAENAIKEDGTFWSQVSPNIVAASLQKIIQK